MVDDPGDVVGRSVALGLARLLKQVAHIDLGYLDGPDRLSDTGYQQRRDGAGIEAAGAHHHQLGPLDRLERARMGDRVGRIQLHPLALRPVGRQRGLPANHATVGEVGNQLHQIGGGGHHPAAHRQHPGRLGDGLIEAAQHVGHAGKEEVAEAVPGQLAGGEAMLEQVSHQRLVLGQGG